MLNKFVLATISVQESHVMIGWVIEAMVTILPLLIIMMLVPIGFKILMQHGANVARSSSIESRSDTTPLFDVEKLNKTFQKKMKKGDFTIADQRKLFDAVLTLFNYRLIAADAPLSVKVEHIQKFIKKYEDPVVDFAITEQHILVQAAWEWLYKHEKMNFDEDNVIKGQFQKLKEELTALIETAYEKVKEAEQSLVNEFLEEEKMIANGLESTVDELREQLKVSKEQI